MRVLSKKIQQSKSNSESNQMLSLMQKVRAIHDARREGKLTAEQAARKLHDLKAGKNLEVSPAA